MAAKRESAASPVPTSRAHGRGPTIWLAGEPDDLKEWMPLGIAGIVTNPVVLNQYAKAHGTVIDLIKKYLDITDKPIVMEIDGHTVEELPLLYREVAYAPTVDACQEPLYLTPVQLVYRG